MNKSLNIEREFLSIDETAKTLNCSKDTIYREIYGANKLKAIKIGRIYRIPINTIYEIAKNGEI